MSFLALVLAFFAGVVVQRDHGIVFSAIAVALMVGAVIVSDLAHKE